MQQREVRVHGGRPAFVVSVANGSEISGAAVQEATQDKISKGVCVCTKMKMQQSNIARVCKFLVVARTISRHRNLRVIVT
jgi:hypothetical protein